MVKQVVDDDGWTHVVTGRRRPALPTPADLSLGDRSCTGESGVGSPARVAEQQWRYTKLWEDSQCCKDLTSILRGSTSPIASLQIDNCVCLGLGSVTDGRQASKHQLPTLLCMVELLRQVHPITQCIIQDPAFNHADEAYLQTLGLNVVKTPSAFSAINGGTFLFAPHLEFEHLATALRDQTPALCVASDVEAYLLRLESACISSDKEAVLERYISKVRPVTFPQYEWDDWWHFTKLYWRDTTPDPLEVESIER